MSAPEPSLTPQAWCRRILTALNQRQVAGREAGDLEMLLTYFIELDPSPPAFTELLARFANDSRAGIAEAATLLQRSWLRGRTGTAAPPMPSLSETLRTVGALLDDALARAAFIAIAPEAVQVQMFGEPHALVWGPHELQQEVAARRALRGQVAPADPTVPERYETRLRAVGTVLEAEPEQAYLLAATRQTVIVEGSEGYHHVFRNEDLAPLLRAIACRQEPDQGASA